MEQGAKTYAAMVTRADGYIGEVMSLLNQFGLKDNTVVFITSDNGAHFGEEKGFGLFHSNGVLRGQKGELYEGGIRTPMIVRWPGKVKAGAVSGVPWAFWDFMPTAAEIAGAKPPAGIDGVSVVPVLTGSTREPHEFIYWEADFFDMKTGARRWRACRRRCGWASGRRSAEAGRAAGVVQPQVRHCGGARCGRANPQVAAKIEQYLKTARTEPRPHNTGSMSWVK